MTETLKDRHSIFLYTPGFQTNNFYYQSVVRVKACSDAIKCCSLLQDALDVSKEISLLIKESPSRDALFQSIKERVLCLKSYAQPDGQ